MESPRYHQIFSYHVPGRTRDLGYLLNLIQLCWFYFLKKKSKRLNGDSWPTRGKNRFSWFEDEVNDSLEVKHGTSRSFENALLVSVKKSSSSLKIVKKISRNFHIICMSEAQILWEGKKRQRICYKIIKIDQQYLLVW